MLEVREIQDGLAEDFEVSVLVGDGCRIFVVNNFGGAQAPQRRRCAVALASRELTILEFRDVAFAPCCTLCADAGFILRDHT